MTWDSQGTTTLITAVLFLLLFIVLLTQLGMIWFYQHRLLSFQTGFLSLCAVWTLLRFLWFMESLWLNLPVILARILYWLPINIEFATFSLIVLFFAQVVHRDGWESDGIGGGGLKKRFVITWIAVNSILFLLNAVWIALVGSAQQCSENMRVIRVAFTAAIFFILAWIVGLYGYRLINTLEGMKMSVPVFLPSTVTLRRVRALLICVLSIFLSRGIYDVVMVFKQRGNFGIKNRRIDLISTITLLVWEFLPITVMLIHFRGVPRTGLGRTGRTLLSGVDTESAYDSVRYSERSTNSILGEDSRLTISTTAGNWLGNNEELEVDNQCGKMQRLPTRRRSSDTFSVLPPPVSFFSNPLRYDSDDESCLLTSDTTSSDRVGGAGGSVKIPAGINTHGLVTTVSLALPYSTSVASSTTSYGSVMRASPYRGPSGNSTVDR